MVRGQTKRQRQLWIPFCNHEDKEAKPSHFLPKEGYQNKLSDKVTCMLTGCVGKSDKITQSNEYGTLAASLS